MNREEIRKANEGIVPIELPHAEDYQSALRELEAAEASFFGINRVVWLQVREAITSIGNALDLFKIGYPDAACYCLRQSIELATCFAYFHELPERERKAKLAAWQTQSSWFPLRGKMETKLESVGGEYADMHKRMPSFFTHIKEINERINKHIHKQGYDFCYHYRHFMPIEKKRQLVESLIREYESFVETAIGVVAVFKLVIDSLPILLSEEDVANRLPGLLTEPYSPVFMENYIGREFVAEFKTTQRYKDFKEDIIRRPRLNDAVYNLKQWQIFERKNASQVLEQCEQLDYFERLVVLLALHSNKVAHVYFYDGLLMFVTDVKCNRTITSQSSDDFKKIRLSGQKKNIQFKGVLLTVFETYDNDSCFVEHDSPFEDEEWLTLCKLVADLNNTITEQIKGMEQATT